MLSPGDSENSKKHVSQKTLSNQELQKLLNRPTRMGWLYNMISGHGLSYEFGDLSKEWIRTRVATADVSTRRDRQHSVWWEQSPGPGVLNKVPGGQGVSPLSGLSTRSLPSAGSLGTLKRNQNSTSVPPPPPPLPSSYTNPNNNSLSVPQSPPSGSVGSGLAHLPPSALINYSTCLSTPSLRNDFLEYLQDNEAALALEFMLAVEKWKAKFFGGRGSKIELGHDDDDDEDNEDDDDDDEDKKGTLTGTSSVSLKFDVVLLGARKVYASFLEKVATHGDDSVQVKKETRNIIRIRLGLPDSEVEVPIIGNTPSPSPTSQTPPPPPPPPVLSSTGVSEDMFDEAVNQVSNHLQNVLWNQFIESEEYASMCEDKYTEDCEKKKREEVMKAKAAQLAAALALSSPNAPPGTSMVQNQTLPKDDDVIASVQFGGQKAPEWRNVENYKSIHFDLIEAKVDRNKEKSPIFALVSVDSATLRSIRTSENKWSPVEHFEFPLLPTTQCLECSLWASSSRFLGFITLPIARLIKSSSSIAPAEPTWMKLMAKPGTTDVNANELCVRVYLGPDEATPDTRHEQIFEPGLINNALADTVREKVSKKKKRFQQDGFDLDLSYITPHIIAMGYPSEGMEGVYRNPLETVQNFFRRRHYKAFKLYNLCSERAYDANKFEGAVSRYPFDDHNPCEFEVIKAFCEDVRTHLSQHAQNVVAIHCKAGKGRTGMMVACYLIYSGICSSAAAALALFADRRTKNKKGVTIASQIRYVHYFETYCNLKRQTSIGPGKTTLFLDALTLYTIPKVALGDESKLFVRIIVHGQLFFTTKENIDPQLLIYKEKKESVLGDLSSKEKIKKEDKKYVVWNIGKKLIPLNDDVLFEIVLEKPLSKVNVLAFWIHSRFIQLQYDENDSAPPRLVLSKNEIDKACKDSKHKKYSENLRIELTFAKTGLEKVKEQELRKK